MNSEEINGIDLQPYKNKVESYILRKQVVMDESYTVEDVIIVGLRKLEREKKWQLKHGSQSQKEKIAKLEAQIRELGAEPVEFTKQEE